MSNWRAAPSVAALLTQASARWPNRSVTADGIIGDAAHAATVSDHNPDSRGVVHAADLTHDPAHGVDCAAIAAGIVTRRDPRVRYLIFNRRICLGPGSTSVLAGQAQPWVWAQYNGVSPHTDHLHVSVGYNARAENDTNNWFRPTGLSQHVLHLLAALHRRNHGGK